MKFESTEINCFFLRNLNFKLARPKGTTFKFFVGLEMTTTCKFTEKFYQIYSMSSGFSSVRDKFKLTGLFTYYLH